MLSRTCRLWRRLESWPGPRRKRWQTSPADSSSTRLDRAVAVADGPLIVFACSWYFGPTQERLRIAWKWACATTPTASKGQRCLAPPLAAMHTPSLTRLVASSGRSSVVAATLAPWSPHPGHHYFDLIVDAAKDRRVSWSDSYYQ